MLKKIRSFQDQEQPATQLGRDVFRPRITSKLISGMLGCLLVAVFAGRASASDQDDKRLIARSDFFQGIERIDLKADTQGERLLFRWRDQPSQIRYITVDNPRDVHVLDTEQAIVSWAPTSNGVAYLYQVEGGRRIGTMTWEGERKNVETEFTINSAALNAVRGNRFAFSISASGEDNSGIYIFDAAEGTLEKRYPLQPHPSLFFDGEMNFVAAHRNRPGSGKEFFLYDAEQEAWQSFLAHEWSMDESMLGGFSKIVSVSDDGNSVYYTSNAETDKTQLYRLDLPSKQVTSLAQDEQVDLLPFGFSADESGHVTSVVGLFAKTIRATTNEAWEADFAIVSEQLTGDVGFIQSCDDDRRWFLREFTGGPIKFYMFDRDTKTLTKLIDDLPSLSDATLASRHAFSVKSRDGLDLPIHVYLPPGTDEDGDGIPNQPLPAVMYVHGGPWAGVVHWNQHFHCRNFQLLANRGYAVINCEFRGSVGMGKAFVEKSQKAWRTGMTRDKVDIADWVVENKIAAEGKVAIWGWSYGGYAAMAGLTFFPEKYACGIAMYGISDMEAFAKSDYANNAFWHNWVGDPFDESDQTMLQHASPLHAVADLESPILLTTGGQDQRVPQKQMDDMANAAHDAGKDVIYLVYPEEVHDYRSPESWISFWAIAEQFLARNLGGRYQPNQGDTALEQFSVEHGSEFVGSLK